MGHKAGFKPDAADELYRVRTVSKEYIDIDGKYPMMAIATRVQQILSKTKRATREKL